MTEDERREIRDLIAEWSKDDDGMPNYYKADNLIMALFNAGFNIVLNWRTYEPVDIVAMLDQRANSYADVGMDVYSRVAIGDASDVEEWRGLLVAELERLGDRSGDYAADIAYRHAARLVRGEP